MSSIFNTMTTPNMEDDKTATPKKIDIIGRLPPELVEIILFYLTPEDLTSAVSCCVRWKAVISYNYFWNTLCLREAYPEVEESQRSEFYTNFFKKYNYWQAVYWYNYTLRQNWINGHCKEVTLEIKEPDNQLLWWFADGIFLVRNKCKKKLFVFNLKTTELKRTVFSLGEEKPQFGYEKILKSGKYLSYLVKRKTLTVWDYENEIKVLDESWNDVTDMYAFQNLFVLETDDDNAFKVFNIESGQIEYKTRGVFRNIVIMDGRMVFLTEDHAIQIVKWEDKSLVTLKCCPYQGTGLHKFLVKSDLLLSFCKFYEYVCHTPTSLCVWNITTKTKLYSINLGPLRTNDVCFINNYLYLNYFQEKDDDGNFLEKFNLFDYTKRTVVASVTNLDASVPISNDQFIVVCRSRKLGLWCLKTRNFVCDLDINFQKNYWHCTNLKITKTKLAYAVEVGLDFVTLHLRDYEIS